MPYWRNRENDMLADRVNNLIPSITVELNAKVAALKELGQDIIALNAGESDFNTPLEIVDECNMHWTLVKPNMCLAAG